IFNLRFITFNLMSPSQSVLRLSPFDFLTFDFRLILFVATLYQFDVFINQRLLMQDRVGWIPCVLPSGYIGKVFIVALSFTILSLVLFAEVTSTRLVAVERIFCEQFAQFKEVGYAHGFLEFRVE